MAKKLKGVLMGLLDKQEDRADAIKRIAKQGGIDEATVTDIVSGDIECPPGKRLNAFASVLGVEVGTLNAAADRGGCGDEPEAEVKEQKCDMHEMKQSVHEAHVQEQRQANADKFNNITSKDLHKK